MNYSYYYIDEVENVSNIHCDLFLSAYDGCDRTSDTYSNINANNKYWIVFKQYNIEAEKLPKSYLTSDKIDENDFIKDIFNNIKIDSDCKICIDSTGFLIPHIIFLIKYLKLIGIKKFEVLYSEPLKYLNDEDTVFTISAEQTRPIFGYQAVPANIGGDDILIVFAGFNDSLVTIVAKDKNKASEKYFFTGFPSLQADMYQQNLIQLNKSKETIGSTRVSYMKASAYDPFVAAEKVQKIIDEAMQKEKTEKSLNCIHIAPLSTKPMAIAAALVYLYNPACPIDIIYPPSSVYKVGHAIGIKRTWKYIIEL